MKLLIKFFREEGATAVEYSIMVGLIAIVIVTAVAAIGTSLDGMFNNFLAEMGWN